MEDYTKKKKNLFGEPVEDLQPKMWNGHLSFPSGRMPKFRKVQKPLNEGTRKTIC